MIVQKWAPAFGCQALMPDKSFKPISLDDFKGSYLVLFLYSHDFASSACQTEIRSLSDRCENFKDINTQVIVASCESKDTHLASVNTPRLLGGLGDICIPLISDESGQLSRDYGTLLDSGRDEGVFIIDPVGGIKQVATNDLPVNRVDEVLRLVQGHDL